MTMSIELSQPLKKLESLRSALDIIRYISAQNNGVAHSYDIMEGLSITDRRFKKAIRRLATTGYVQMANDLEYRLTEQGVLAAEELAEYDRHMAEGAVTEEAPANKIQRRLVVVLPRTLMSGQVIPFTVGFSPDVQQQFSQPATVVVRLAAINGVLSTDSDEMISLSNDASQKRVFVKVGRFSPVRLRVQIYQLDASGLDITHCGGMHIDVDVTADAQQPGLVAYGADVFFDPTG